MPDLQAAIEQWISTLSDNEFRMLAARTRPPDEPLPPKPPTTEGAQR
jgi:hypothetical protein